jgi:tetratricopeptide (TPR) repeat protein
MKATENTRIIVQVSPDEATWIRYGDEKMFRGEFEKAVQDYEKAIGFRTTSSRAWQAKANALEALENYNEALKCYDKALECDEGDAECWFYKGTTLKKVGRPKDGAACIDTGIHIAMGSR